MVAPGVTDEGVSLAPWDDLAPRLVEAVAPIRFDLARSPSEREAVYRLRYRAIVERGWAEPAEFPDGLERDGYDDVAVHVVGWKEDILVTTGRLVFPGTGRLLPTEEAFGLTIEPAGRVADLGRMVVAPEARGRGHKIFLALLARSWSECRARGCTSVCGVFTPSMVRLCERLGVRLNPVGPARRYWGEERHPVLLDIAASDVERTSAGLGARSARPRS